VTICLGEVSGVNKWCIAICALQVLVKQQEA
jgi:hypothetical protein